MNARLCKQLRGLARARSVGMPEREYSKKFFTRTYETLGLDGRLKEVKYQVYTARVVASSTRGVYRALKKAWKEVTT